MGVPSHLADSKELSRLRLYAFRRVQNHDRAIGCGQCSVSVFTEIVMTRRIEKVPPNIAYSNCSTDDVMEMPRFFSSSIQSLTRAARLGLARFYRTRRVNCSSIEKELLGQRGLARVRMRDDRKRATAFVRLTHCESLVAARIFGNGWRHGRGGLVRQLCVVVQQFIKGVPHLGDLIMKQEIFVLARLHAECVRQAFHKIHPRLRLFRRRHRSSWQLIQAIDGVSWVGHPRTL